MKRIITVVLILTSLAATGQTITDFTATDVVSGKSLTLSSQASSQGMVAVFISNTCPFDAYYYARLNKLTADFSGRVPFVFINSHSGVDESAEAMKSLASTHRFTVPYLEDKNQAIMRQLKVTKSPEVIVLKPADNGFTVFYRGAIDDNAQVATDVHQHYLADALNALLSGQIPPRPVVRPVGCTIRQH
ncbi:MAG TPA: redoxin domain-containing protein [Cyclobacteriaceae bacterium]|nr:redoxin domain-containing protein [Cyclobacteriaceae bacterium]